jgi:hypothetical protein
MPIGIFLFDQRYFPIPPPFLQLFLALDGGGRIIKDFKIDEAIDVVPPCEAWYCFDS